MKSSIFLFAILIATTYTSVNINRKSFDFTIEDETPTERFNLRAEVDPKLVDFQEEIKFTCTGGLDPESLSKKEYLAAFAAGPCSPALLLPGLSASNLKIVIEDCKLFRKKRFSTFTSCGWKHCIRRLPGSPKREYTGWLPDNLSPMSLANPTKAHKRCFTGLLGLGLKTDDEKHEFTFEMVPGVKLVPFGESPKTRTREASDCGATAIELTRGKKYYINMLNTMRAAGYVNGLTFQTLAYDWRLSVGKTTASNKYEGILEDLNAITGKKVTIVAHSLGNYVTVSNLWRISQEKKDRLVREYFMIASPTLGSPESNTVPLAGVDSFAVNVGIFKVGITFKMAKKTVMNYPAIYQLTVQDTFEVCKDEDWLKEVKTRIENEENNLDQKGKGFLSIFPSFKEKCLSRFTDAEDGCKFGLHELWNMGTIEGQTVNPRNYFDFLKKYSFVENSPHFEEISQSDNHDRLKNPGVKMNIVFANHLDTISGFDFKTNPLKKTKKNKYYYPELFHKQGDGVVLATSSVVPAMKWMHDFYNKNDENARRVHLVQFCGEYNVKNSDREAKGEENDFYGLECKCRPEEGEERIKGTDCEHNKLMGRTGIIKYLVKSFFEAEQGQVGDKFVQMNEKELDDFSDNCKMLNRD